MLDFGNKVIKTINPEAELQGLEFLDLCFFFWYQKKFHIFLITPVALYTVQCDMYSWKMYLLEDINENVTSYGNHS